MRYRHSISYLESFKPRGIRLGLDRIKKLLKILGDPQDKFKTVHIAGTNGKGSVAAMLSSILTSAGYRTGLYTSPHLVDYTERVRINEKDISKGKFAAAISRVKNAISKMRDVPFTEFEVLTAAGFLMLAKEKPDIAVIEVGLGGRFDSTNVITPILSIITNIGMDHIDLLGNSLDSIAREKGGIIKPGVPLVTGERKVTRVLKSICRNNRSMLIQARPYDEHLSPLAGRHQADNMNVALTAVDLLRKKGFSIKTADIKNGLKRTRWPGRLETVHNDPLIVIDGAHNVPGARALAEHLKGCGEQFSFVIGMQANKDIKGFINTLRPLAKRFIVVRSSNPSAAMEDRIVRVCGKGSIHAGSIRAALDIAKRSASPICVTGSLYLIGDALKQKAFDL